MDVNAYRDLVGLAYLYSSLPRLNDMHAKYSSNARNEKKHKETCRKNKLKRKKKNKKR